MKLDLTSLVKRVRAQRQGRLYSPWGSEPAVIDRRKTRKTSKKRTAKVSFTTKTGVKVAFTPGTKRKAARQGKLSRYNKFVRDHIHDFLPDTGGMSKTDAVQAAQSAMRKVAKLWKSSGRSRRVA
jgi:hypothetical protein